MTQEIIIVGNKYRTETIRRITSQIGSSLAGGGLGYVDISGGEISKASKYFHQAVREDYGSYDGFFKNKKGNVVVEEGFLEACRRYIKTYTLKDSLHCSTSTLMNIAQSIIKENKDRERAIQEMNDTERIFKDVDVPIHIEAFHNPECADARYDYDHRKKFPVTSHHLTGYDVLKEAENRSSRIKIPIYEYDDMPMEIDSDCPVKLISGNPNCRAKLSISHYPNGHYMLGPSKKSSDEIPDDKEFANEDEIWDNMDNEGRRIIGENLEKRFDILGSEICTIVEMIVGGNRRTKRCWKDNLEQVLSDYHPDAIII